MRKLGYGAYSTVWMCWDKMVRRVCAVKVIQASKSEEHYEKEVRLFAELSRNDDQVSVEE